MIYQENSEFKVIPFKAKIGTETHLVVNKSQFENDLRMQSEDNSLPVIAYSPNTLTTEQQSRFDEVKLINGISLDEIRSYVVDNIEGDSVIFQMIKLQRDNSALELQNSNLTLELADKETRVQSLEMQNSLILLDLATLKGGI